MDIVQSNIADLLKNRQKNGLYRKRSIGNSATSNDLSFMTNDYLSLSTDESLKERFMDAFLTFSTGSGGSPVNGGRTLAHEQLECRIAELTNCDTAILFNSGYQANLAIMALLGHLEIPVVVDKAIHASIYDGIQLGRVTSSRFRHMDFSHLRSKLSPHKIVITEGMFSMSGMIPPLNDYRDLVVDRQCGLMIDEAHSFGILGQQGLGACELYQLHQDLVPLRMISFAKSGAAMGAAVVGQFQWIDAMVQFSRPYIYSTTMSPALAHALHYTVTAIIEAEEARQHLRTLSQYFNERAHDSALNWRMTDSPIKQLLLGCSDMSLRLQKYLAENKIRVQAIRAPTVPAKETGLRLSLNAHHQLAEIDFFFDTLIKSTKIS